MDLINRLLGLKYLTITFKAVTLIVYVFLIVTGLSAYSQDPILLMQLRNTNVGNLIVWSYWWPAIVIMAIFFGRIWCMVCPVELITSLMTIIGIRGKRPGWLKSGWGITVFYALILFVGIQVFAIHRVPLYMSIYLITILLIAVVVGYIWEKNTFCRYVCPVGYLLALYSKFAMFGWRVKNPAVCATCTDKSCISSKFQYKVDDKSCGVGLYPARIDDNEHCILCAGCLKACDTQNMGKQGDRPNPGLSFIGLGKGLQNIKPLAIPELAFVVLVSGFVVSEIWSEWPTTAKILALLPDQVLKPLSITNIAWKEFISGLLLFGVLPVAIWLIPWIIAKFNGSTIKVKNYFTHYGLAFIPIIAAAHLDKALLKSTSRIPYLKHVASDLSGINTAHDIVNKSVILSANPKWMVITISILMTFVMLAGVWLSQRVIRNVNGYLGDHRSLKWYYLVPIFYGSVFLSMIIIWRWFAY